MDYISPNNWYDIPRLVFPIMIYLIEGCYSQGNYLTKSSKWWSWNRTFVNISDAITNWFTVMEYPFHRWYRICSLRHNYNPLPFSRIWPTELFTIICLLVFFFFSHGVVSLFFIYEFEYPSGIFRPSFSFFSFFLRKSCLKRTSYE